jgi:hypothetical protein
VALRPVRNDVAMKSRARREEQTVVIATTLAVSVATLVLGVAVTALIGIGTDMSRALQAGLPWALALAAGAGATYLLRNNR